MTATRLPAAAGLLLVVGVTAGAITAQVPVPRYEVKRASTPPTIDGRLDEPSWAAAPAVTLQFLWESQTGAKQMTRARLLWDAQALYVGFDADDADITAQYQQRDDPTYRDDAVEIFINANPQQEVVYYGFEMNARGVLYDYLNYNSRTLFKRFDATGERSHRHGQRVEPRGDDPVAEFRGAVAAPAERRHRLEGEFQPVGRRRAESAHEHLVRSAEHRIVATCSIAVRRDRVRQLTVARFAAISGDARGPRPSRTTEGRAYDPR
jgi:hypothetical protein